MSQHSKQFCNIYLNIIDNIDIYTKKNSVPNVKFNYSFNLFFLQIYNKFEFKKKFMNVKNLIFK